MNDALPFFDRSSTQQAIESLAETASLSLFLGAGVSAESALPPWQTLIERILGKVAENHHVPPEHIDGFVSALIDQHGLLTAAAIAQSSLNPQSMRYAVRDALYGRVDYDPRPGFHSQVIADFVVQELAAGRDRFRIVTTNYDRLIETALTERVRIFRERDDEPERRPVSVTGEGVIPEDRFPIYHIHGCLAPGDDHSAREFIGDSHRIVLGERDYAQLQTGGRHWQDAIVRTLLESRDTCLFTGMSLADPNIIRYLTYPSVDGGDRYALFCRQSKRIGDLPQPVVQKYDEAVRRRVSALNVRSITADYYIQVPQFLSEVLLRRSLAEPLTEDLQYENRLRTWRSTIEAVLPRRPDVTFQAGQRMLRNALRTVLEQARGLIAEYVDIDAEERLALELWFRNPGPARALELWGSSTQTWSGYDDLVKPRISYDSQFTAVQAFTRGGGQYRLNGRPGSRWKYQWSFPIRLSGGPWFNLPVGCVVLSSSLQQDASCLYKVHGPTRRAVEELVLQAGTRLCDPAEIRALAEWESS